jgi:hypothetical protein
MADAVSLTPEPYAVVAEFTTPDALLAATRQAREAGFRDIEAFSPFPVDGLSEALGFAEGRIGPLMVIGGVVGMITATLMQAGVALDFPLNIGGRPLISWPAYALICFEFTVLGAVLTGVTAFLILSRLPKLHHPLFDIPTFHLATADKFFLAILATDPKFEPEAARHFLAGLKPLRIDVAPDWGKAR